MPNKTSSRPALKPVLPSSPPASDAERVFREREHGLLQTITALRQEVQQYREHGANKIVTRERTVEPPDYREIKQVNRILKDENQRLRRIIDTGHIAYLESMIDDFIESSRNAIRPITHEIMLSNYDKEDVTKVQQLIDFLRELQCELNAFLAIQQDGIESAASMAKQQIHQDAQRLIRQFSNADALSSLSEDQLEALHLQLQNQRSELSQFFQQLKPKKAGRGV